MSRNQHDQFIDDDEEETCPLCVEEFDLTDKGFKPCTCGYQICQFCYHNVKNNMNGLCPACRRPYNDKDIEYKTITPEQSAAHRARQAQKQKKTQAALQKEKQKAEADHLSRKHLAGLRVVQKNLVYVTGLSPTTQEDQLLHTLRGDQYFGQYGEIVKIVVSKAKDPSHPQSVGVYVTYKHKEDAASCIAAVDGSKNGERTLRAQYGTTKYCSAYLRGENCQNRSCMFLHEPGEASDSYSRADLSALNAGGSQHGSHRPPPPQSQQPVASAAQPMTRQTSDQNHSPTERPALPSHASWASKPQAPLSSYAGSRAASVAQESPALGHATPATHVDQPQDNIPQPLESSSASDDVVAPKRVDFNRAQANDLLISLVKDFDPNLLRFSFSLSSLPKLEADLIDGYPLLFDNNGGARRRLRRQREEEQRQLDQDTQSFQQLSTLDHEGNPELSGSLQLGGEPEDRLNLGQLPGAIQPPAHDPTGLLDHRFQFGGLPTPGSGERPSALQQQQHQQHQQLLLQTIKSSGTPTQTQTSSMHSASNPPGHQRNASRYSFANESSASTSVKPVASAKLLNQQSSIMPQNGGAHFTGHQPHSNQFYTSNVQGPPPGLKATGTPPVSGGMTFGQGHGFATGGLQYNSNASGRNANEEMMRNLLRGRDAGNIVPTGDAAKHDLNFPPLNVRKRHQSSHQHGISLDHTGSRHSTPPIPPGFELQQLNESRRSTPTVPPGLSRPSALPSDRGSGSFSRSSSSASLRRLGSQVAPALPLRPATPVKQTPETPTVAVDPENRESDVLTDAIKAESEKAELTTESATASGSPVEGSQQARLHDPPQKRPIETTTEQETIEDAEPSAQGRGYGESNLRTSPAATGTGSAEEVYTRISQDVATAPNARERTVNKKKTQAALDLTSATKGTKDNLVSTQEASEGPRKASRMSDAVSTNPKVADPQSTTTTSSASRPVPRTIRVLPTPKEDTIPPVPNQTPSTPASVTAKTLHSHQQSIASNNTPGTPTSEYVSVSDNMSIASTSQSRASSPPPLGSVHGTVATPRGKTKSRAKKERQERAKLIESEKERTPTAESPKVLENPPAQEAIVSRKKKTKKEKESTAKSKATVASADATGGSIPTISQSPTPGRKGTPEVAETQGTRQINRTETSATDKRSPAPQSPISRSRQDQLPSFTSATAAQLLVEIKASTEDFSKSIESLFRSPASHLRHTLPIAAEDLRDPDAWRNHWKMDITKDDIDKLLKGNLSAFKYGGADGRVWSRGMVAPSGAHLRALTDELETRFLELERQIRDLPDSFRFHPTKPQNDTHFPTVDLTALKRHLDGGPAARGVSVMEQMIQDGTTMKKGAFLVDEATKYLNEFVMPPATPPPPPPPSSSTNAHSQATSSNHGHHGQHGSSSTGSSHMGNVSVDIAERALHEARRVAEERDAALRKVFKKNRKLLGLA